MSAPLLDAYKKMQLIRIAEQEIANFYLANKVMSFVHFYVGQEAVAVGVCAALAKGDKVMGNHRSHGHYLAKGGDLKRMVCELLGKAPGSSKGKGGSMHMIDKSVDFVGSTPILGSVVPLACGVAFEQKYNKRNNLTVSFVGDGASEEGVVYETINLAALFKLPYLIVVENNLYSVNSKIKDRRSEGYNVEKVVTGLGGIYLRADGNDFEDVFAKAATAVEKIRTIGGPVVLECITYRHMAHSAPLFDDAQGYREEDPLEKRLERDPIKRLKQALLDAGTSETELAQIETEIRATVLDAIAFAQTAPFPAKDTLYTEVYAK